MNNVWYQIIADSLRKPAIAALVDLADGFPFVADTWIRWALEKRGLIYSLHQQIEAGVYRDELTPLGKEFVAWLRQPRELPTQTNMFEDE
jgi:hypothetical protein